MKLALSLMLFVSLNATAAPLPLAAQIIACESSGHHLKHGRLNCNTHEPKGGQSCGIAQYQEATFRDFRQRARIPWLRWTSEHDQIVLFKWALAHGKANHWACFRKIVSGEWVMKADLDMAIRKNEVMMKALQ